MNSSALRRPVGRGVAAVAGLAVLAVVTLLALWAVTPPSPRSADAPADKFSAARAHQFLAKYATTPHPVGSTANDTVRDYLVSTLAGFGLSPRVQDAIGAEQQDSTIGGGGGAVSLAHVRNIVVNIAGSAPTGRVFLVAHYDSVQNGPGANDDGAGVTTLLELARALTASQYTPRNDLVLVFTDAEEACLCGAEAFAGQDPLAAGGGVVLNLEARGSSGPPIMFETSTGNAKLVGVYRGVPYPVGTSFAVEVYRILPNDTDFSAFRDQGGFTGLNSAYIDGSAVYHAPEDTVDRVDQGSVQAHGDNALALAKKFGGIDLTGYDAPAGYDDTYFPAFGALVTYPGWLVWPVAILALLVVAAFGLLAVRRGRLRVGAAAAGFGLALVPLLLAAAAAQLYWLLLTTLRPGYANMIDPWRPGWYRLGVVALTVTILLTWYGLARRRFSPTGLWFGALAWLALLGVVFAAVTPGGSYLGAVPALAGGLAALALTTRRKRLARQTATYAATPAGPTPAQGLALLLGGAVAVVILAPTALLFFPALGLATGAAAAFFVAMLGLALLPVFEWVYPRPDQPTPRRGWLRASALPGLVCGLLAVACTATGLAVDGFDARHPVPSQLMYALDKTTGQARWLSTESDPGAWTAHYVTGRENLDAEYPLVGDDVATGPAAVADLPAPTVAVVSDRTADGARTLTFDLTSHRQVRLSYFAVQGAAHVRAATIAGRSLSAAQLHDPFSVLFHAPAGGVLRVTLVLDASTAPLTLRVMDGSDGLDKLPGFVPRPAGVTVAGTHISELVLVADTVTVPAAG